MALGEIYSVIKTIKKLFDKHKDLPTVVPTVWSLIDYLSEKQITSSRSISLHHYITIIHLYIASETIDQVLDAEKTLKELQQSSVLSKTNAKNKIEKYLECLEKTYSVMNRIFYAIVKKPELASSDYICTDEGQIFKNGEFFKQQNCLEKIFKDEDFRISHTKVTNALKDYMEELEKLYEELVEMKVHYIGEREEKRFVKGFQDLAVFAAGTVLLGGFAAMAFKSPEIPTAGVALAATGLAFGVAWKNQNTDENNNTDQDAITKLGEARSKVLEAKIVVDRFRTDLELLDITGRYDKNVLDRILQNVKNCASPLT